jgi:hypothetical protein
MNSTWHNWKSDDFFRFYFEDTGIENRIVVIDT